MSATKILAICGKKQSGKSSLCAFIEASILSNCSNAGENLKFSQQEDGQIFWENDRPSDVRKNDRPCGIYNFGDSLKQVCIELLGLKPEQVYGTDAQKNSPTHLRWENLPFWIRFRNAGMRSFLDGTETVESPATTESKFLSTLISLGGAAVPCQRTGIMTGREVMQVFGTDIMRQMFDENLWVNATLNRILRERPRIAMIADLRFKTELESVYSAGAYVIRLERKITNDNHQSEIDLDDYSFNKPRMLIIPSDADIRKKNDIAITWLRGHGII